MEKKQKTFSLVLLILAFAVSIFAQSTEELMTNANSLLANGAYDQAISKYRKIVSRDPGNFEAQFNIAIAYLNWERYSNAITEFNKAVRVNPNSGEAWSNLAYAYEKQGQSEKAADALSRAVASNPNNVTVRMNLAAVYAQKNRYDQAIAQYKQIIQMDAANLDAHVSLAKCLISRNNHAEAKKYLKSAIALNPNEAEAYWELGNILWDNEKNDAGAIENYKKAIVLKPNSQVYYTNYGTLLEELWKKNKDDSKKLEAIDLWKKSLVYLDDALDKEKVQDRIDKLEKGEAPSGKATTEELFDKSEPTKADIQQLKNEMGKDGAETKKIDVKDYDVTDDLDVLNKESSSDFDIQKAMEKKKKAKEAEQNK